MEQRRSFLGKRPEKRCSPANERRSPPGGARRTPAGVRVVWRTRVEPRRARRREAWRDRRKPGILSARPETVVGASRAHLEVAVRARLRGGRSGWRRGSPIAPATARERCLRATSGGRAEELNLGWFALTHAAVTSTAKRGSGGGVRSKRPVPASDPEPEQPRVRNSTQARFQRKERGSSLPSA